MQKYPEYKDSGVEWLGEIPSHWHSKPLYTIGQVVSEINNQDRELLSVYLERGVIKFSDVTEKRTNVTSEDLSKYQSVEPGYLVLNNQQAWRGSVGVSKHSGIISPAYIVLALSNKINSDFANYLFRDGIMVSLYLICSKGVGTIQRNLYWPQLKRANVCFPPLPEQTAIADFLDRKTALIDQAIGIKHKQIDLLKERRQILIHKAVTRGLNPNVKMKDSGVEWIGEIPEGWEVLYNRRLFREKGRKITNSDELPLSLSQADGVIPSETMKEKSLSPSHRDNFKLCLPGDLVVNRFKGHLGVFFETSYRGIVTFHYGVFEPEKNVCSKYFELLFHTETYKTIYAGKSNGMTIGLQNLSNQNFYDVQSLVPPFNEQRDIIEYCKVISEKVEAAISLKEQEIEKLKEYKATLINSAVTGKIKVC
jgi:type I restriction enzyme S subunit